jgi:ATP-binding cassette, subfamily B, bacterial HlyB/CyaB
LLNTSISARNFKNYLSEREVEKDSIVSLISCFEAYESSGDSDVEFENHLVFIDEGKIRCHSEGSLSAFIVDTIATKGSWIGGNALMPPFKNTYLAQCLTDVKGWRLSLEHVSEIARDNMTLMESLYLEPWLDMRREDSEVNFDHLRILTDIPAQKMNIDEVTEQYGLRLDKDAFNFADNDFDAIPVVIIIYAALLGRHYPLDNIKEMLVRFNGKVSSLRMGMMFESLNVLTKSNKCNVKEISSTYDEFAFFYGGRLLICFKKSNLGYLCLDGVDGFVFFKKKQLEELGQYNFLGLMDVSVNEKDGDNVDLKNIQKVVFKFISADKILLLKMLLSSLIVFLFIAIVPSFSAIILDEIIYTYDEDGLIMALSGMLISLMAVVTFTWFKNFYSLRLSITVDDKLSRYLYYNVLKLKPSDISRITVGGVLNRLGELSKVREFFSNESVTTLVNFFSIIIYAAILLTYSFQIVLFPFLIVASLVIIQAIVRKKLKTLNIRIFETQTRMQTFIAESIFSIKTVKAFAAEKTLALGWDRHILETLDSVTRMLKLSNGLDSLISFSSQLVQISGIWIASYLFLNGEMNLSSGDLFGISLYLQRFVDPLNSIVQYFFNYAEVKVAFSKLSDIVPDNASAYDDRHSLRLKGKVRFERMSFRYTQDGPWILRDISFSIFPGQIVGIVGKSGSGKTTLASLISGNLHPTSGKVFYDDFERSFISDESFLSQIGFIEQNNHLYAGSIKSNIAYNDDDPSQDLLDKALDQSYSREFIARFPQGAQTYLAESGLGLSGGQKQRLCIARTIYSDPKIMLFDEATSALDAESEKAISDNLKHILKGRTAFIIAHRLATIRAADLILVLDQGRLMQVGNHDQLIKMEGVYRELFIEQSTS